MEQDLFDFDCDHLYSVWRIHISYQTKYTPGQSHKHCGSWSTLSWDLMLWGKEIAFLDFRTFNYWKQKSLGYYDELEERSSSLSCGISSRCFLWKSFLPPSRQFGPWVIGSLWQHSWQRWFWSWRRPWTLELLKLPVFRRTISSSLEVSKSKLDCKD